MSSGPTASVNRGVLGVRPAGGTGDAGGPEQVGDGSAIDRLADNRTWLTLHLLTLLVAGALLLVVNRGQWFFKDDWEFLTRRTGLGVPGELSVWAPHNGHWSTLPVLAFRGLFAAFGLTTYWPWVVLLVLVHLTGVHLVWRLCVQARVGPAVATVAALVLALLGSGGEDLLWAFQIGFDGAITFAVAMAVVLNRSRLSAVARLAAWALGCGSLMCSGVSLPLLVLPAILCLWRHGPVRTAAVFVVPAAAYLTWSALAGGSPPRAPLTAGAFLQFVGACLWHSASAATGSRVGPFVAALVLVGALVVATTAPWTRRAGSGVLALASTLTVVAVLVSLGVARAGSGIAGAASSRYVHVVAVGATPALAAALATLLRWRPRPLGPALAGLALFALLANVLALQARAEFEAVRETRSHDAVIGALVLHRAGEVLLPDATGDPQSGYSQTDALVRLDRRGEFGRVLPAVPSVILAVQRLRLQLQLAPGTTATHQQGLAVRSAPGTTAAPAGTCATFGSDNGGAPQILVSTRGAPGSVTVTGPQTGAVVAEFLPRAKNPVGAAQVQDLVSGGEPRTLRWLGRAGTVRLTFPGPGQLLVCPPGGSRAP